MKKGVVISCLATLCAAVMAFADAVPRRGRPRGMAKPAGGIVEKVYKGKVLRVLDAQDAVPTDKVVELTRKIRWTSLLPVEVVKGPAERKGCALEAAGGLAAQDGVGAGVLLVEDAKLPIILASPDSRWAILNIAALLSDNPPPDRLLARFTKVYWCAVARSLGVGNSCYQGCVLVPFANLKDLDRIGALQPCPEPFNKMIDSAAAYGIRTLSIASYRDACHQGWAPPPANDEQQAIWNETHSIPKNPIKIEFDPKKGR